MKINTYINGLIIALTLLLSGCGGDDSYPAPEGVWNCLNTETNTSCEMVIGGSNAISTGGVYTRVTVTYGPGNYEILLGGLVMTQNGETGIITFSEAHDGTPNRAFITMIGNNRLLLRFDESSTVGNVTFGMAKSDFPQGISGVWGGETELDETSVKINAVIYPYAVDDSYGKITITYPAVEKSTVYNIVAFLYREINGAATFKLVSTESDQSTISYDGTLYFDYEKDTLEGSVSTDSSNKSYNFTLSPVLTLDGAER